MATFLNEQLDLITSWCETSSLWSLIGTAVILVGVCAAVRRWLERSSAPTLSNLEDETDIKNPTIKPLMDFDWQNTEPLQLRSFQGKHKYNLTMVSTSLLHDQQCCANAPQAIENLDPSEMIPMDKTYKDRLALRQKILKEHHDIAVAVNESATADPRTDSAVSELYLFILGKYLPGRYPSMFKLHPSTKEKPEHFENLVTGASWPIKVSAEMSTIHALEILAQTVDEEFLILLPDLSSPNQPKYILQAYATCFPSGFNTRQKLGLRLADIHGPVPKYAEKLERSMDRFFAKIEVGRVVKRVNWSINTEGTGLFHAFDSEKEVQTIKPGELNVNQTFLRSERQTLHRLPHSKALIFAFHTYLYPLQEIKDEGLGEELAVAIEGLNKGNVPGIYEYKDGDYWGEATKHFLRS
ncbi:hypothetical protein N7478_003318 [Penicillium angulare]|uniref:uncharacterized protein n=1 Tax=Penicillium angulare TaxID=116970 RepID=UPI00253FD5EE|nr:uncharacterized protein N7478_003318 [Penicillium angulare]KAJ5287632.1 hypothetical protein N7478_003318 [Penicillium angulare]